MRISELAKLSDVSSKTIRYYETIGLMPEPSRTFNGYRDYDQDDLDILIFIRRCRNLQIPLEQVKQLLLVRADKTASCQEVDLIIEQQLVTVRKTQDELAILEQALSSLSTCCQQDKVDTCEVLQRLSR
tara:strand:- start:348 stop:734 length:387 start_codon:yes stop_codon:yes gene_type:complete